MGPLNISGTSEATVFKFGVQIDYKDQCPKNAKLGDKGPLPR